MNSCQWIHVLSWVFSLYIIRPMWHTYLTKPVSDVSIIHQRSYTNSGIDTIGD